MKLKIDEQRHEVKLNGREVHLPPVEYRILLALHHAEGVVMDREGLILAIDAGDIGLRAIDQHIARLRKKGFRQIKTVTKFGYQWKA